MLKLKRSFSILVIFLVFLFLVVLCISTYLLASGVRVKYDSSQKRYVLNVSKNEFVKNLLLKYSKNLPLIDKALNEVTSQVERRPSPFGEINEEISKSKSGLVLYNATLLPAIVGRQYKTVIQVGVYEVNGQIDGQVESGLPPGLQLTPCQTEYNSPAIAKIAAKNSFGRCIIEGIPQQSGDFTMKVHFSIKDRAGYFEENIPLVVNP